MESTVNVGNPGFHTEGGGHWDFPPPPKISPLQNYGLYNIPCIRLPSPEFWAPMCATPMTKILHETLQSFVHQQESMSRQDKFCKCLDKVRFILPFWQYKLKCYPKPWCASAQCWPLLIAPWLHTLNCTYMQGSRHCLHRHRNTCTLIDTNQEPISYHLIWHCHIASSTVEKLAL